MVLTVQGSRSLDSVYNKPNAGSRTSYQTRVSHKNYKPLHSYRLSSFNPLCIMLQLARLRSHSYAQSFLHSYKQPRTYVKTPYNWKLPQSPSVASSWGPWQYSREECEGEMQSTRKRVTTRVARFALDNVYICKYPHTPAEWKGWVYDAVF